MTKTATLIAAALLIVAGAAMGQSIGDLQAKAEQGDAQARYGLGNSYYHGGGVPENYRLAAQYGKKPRIKDTYKRNSNWAWLIWILPVTP